MSAKSKVDLADKYRVLMTEVLPYELPLWFSNDVFYEKIKALEQKRKKEKKNEDTKGFFQKIYRIKCDKLENFIPLNYKIRRTGEGIRTLSIMHPVIQTDFCDFYEKFQDVIIYHCNRSQKSLRYPVKVVSSFYTRLG